MYDFLGVLAPLPLGAKHVPSDGPTVRIVEHQAQTPGHAALLPQATDLSVHTPQRLFEVATELNARFLSSEMAFKTCSPRYPQPSAGPNGIGSAEAGLQRWSDQSCQIPFTGGVIEPAGKVLED